MPQPCRSESDFSRSRHSAGWARHGHGMACVNYHRPSIDGTWATCPRSASSGYHAEFHELCYQKHTNPLNCRRNISDLSDYHADFHEGQPTVRAWQWCGMACVNYRGTAWARYGMCELSRHGMGAVWHVLISPKCISVLWLSPILYSYMEAKFGTKKG
jgi:hypothetical protein